MLAGILDELVKMVDRWRAAGGDVDAAGVRPDYLARCDTLGRRVRVLLPDDSEIIGVATDVTPDGAVVVRHAQGFRAFSAGDVTHLRAEPDSAPGRVRGHPGAALGSQG